MLTGQFIDSFVARFFHKVTGKGRAGQDEDSVNALETHTRSCRPQFDGIATHGDREFVPALQAEGIAQLLWQNNAPGLVNLYGFFHARKKYHI